MRVLYVEDHAPLVLLLQTRWPSLVWSSEGSLARAKKRLAAESFDVLLVDLNLPDSKGTDTIRGVTDFDAPVVVLTADKSSTFHAEAWRLGVADYIYKMDLFDIDLVEKLEDVCQNYQQIKRRYSSLSFGSLELVKPYLSCPPFPTISCPNRERVAV